MTDMKPEYRYSTTPRFCVELLPDTIMTNRTGILRVIRRTKPEHRLMKLVELHQRYRDSDVVMQWIFDRMEEKNKLIQLLNTANATFRQKFVPVPIIFPAEVLYDRLHATMIEVGMGNAHYSLFEIRSRYTLSQANAVVRGYSEALAASHEYSLRHWAQANNIVEAYRLIQIITGDSYEACRIWWTPNAINVAFHEGSDKKQQPVSIETHHWQITSADWAQICIFMARHFWTAESWYNPESEQYANSLVYIFEGWRDTTYKFLDHAAFDQQHISYQALQVFSSMIRAYMNALP
jgi:hypothetical protein